MRQLLFSCLFAAALATTFWASLSGQPWTPALGMQRQDLALHLVAYAGTSALGLMAGIRPLWLFALLAALGGGLELAQGAFTAHRTPDALDMLANLIGAALPLVLALALRRRRPSRAGGRGDR